VRRGQGYSKAAKNPFRKKGKRVAVHADHALNTNLWGTGKCHGGGYGGTALLEEAGLNKMSRGNTSGMTACL